jgi:UDP-glucose 4-epimerase
LRYLVTGGAGFIGSHLVDALVARGERVLVLDDLSTGRRENVEHLLGEGQVELVEGSVLDEPLVDRCMQSVDRCFHLASAVGVRLVVDAPLDTLLGIVRGADIVTAAAARHDSRLLLTSTSEVYGKRQDGVVDERSDRLLGATSVARWNYATAKAFAEALAFGYHREHGAEMIVVRIFNTVGPRQSAAYGMVLPRFVRQALNGAELTVYGDGTQSRCFTHVYDSVDAMLRLIECGEACGEAFNVGSRNEVRIVDLAQDVVRRTSSASRIKRVPYDEAYGDGFEELGCRIPDTSALSRLTGWEQRYSLGDAIDGLIEHLTAGEAVAGGASPPSGNGAGATAREVTGIGR